MTILAVLFVLVLSGCTILQHASAVSPPAAASMTPSNSPRADTGSAGPFLGVRAKGFPPSWNAVASFSNATGVAPRLVLYYSGWNEPFSVANAATALAHDAELLIQIEPTDVSMADIADGSYDSYLRSYASQIKRFGHPVVLGFAHEMNGNWYSWGRESTPPSTWVAAWRHIVRLFKRAGVHNVAWLWTISHNDTSYIRRYWPGSRYVTWVGVDGYFSRPSNTFSSVFGSALRIIRRLTTKPILLSEVGVGPLTGHQAADITGLFAGIYQDHLLGMVYFDVDQHGSSAHQDWQLEGNEAALHAFGDGARELVSLRSH